MRAPRSEETLSRRPAPGEIPLFTGIDSPYEEPVAPDLELRTDRDTVEQSLEKLSALALGLARPPEIDGAGAHI